LSKTTQGPLFPKESRNRVRKLIQRLIEGALSQAQGHPKKAESGGYLAVIRNQLLKPILKPRRRRNPSLRLPEEALMTKKRKPEAELAVILN
jgi:hypothetical protein